MDTPDLKTDKDLRKRLAAYMDKHQDDDFVSVAAVFGLTEIEVREFAVDWAIGEV